MKCRFLKYIAIANLLIIGKPDIIAQQPAFPGAEGFGKYSRGSGGGIVLEVTSLDDSGPGTLRDALLSYKGQKQSG